MRPYRYEKETLTPTYDYDPDDIAKFKAASNRLTNAQRAMEGGKITGLNHKPFLACGSEAYKKATVPQQINSDPELAEDMTIRKMCAYCGLGAPTACESGLTRSV